jgi:hypothetical protein
LIEIWKEPRMDQLTERLVEYALTLSYEDLPPEVVERTGIHVKRDTLWYQPVSATA